MHVERDYGRLGNRSPQSTQRRACGAVVATTCTIHPPADVVRLCTYHTSRTTSRREPGLQRPQLALAMTTTPALHTLEISQRPRRTWAQTLNGILAAIVFLSACLMINGSQFVFLLPLKLLPFAWAETVYYEGIRYSKGAFGRLLGTSHRIARCLASAQATDRRVTVLMSQWFAPTKLVVSFEQEGQGRFTEEQIAQVVERDAKGRVVGLHLPQRAVLIANHQVGPSSGRSHLPQDLIIRNVLDRCTLTGGMRGP